MLKATWFVEPFLSVLARASRSAGSQGAAPAGHATKSSDEQYDALTSGAADIAVTAIDNVLDWNRRGKGGDFRVVAQIETTTPMSLVCQASIAEISDLRGRTLLVDALDNGFVVALRAFLASHGLPSTAYQLESAGGGLERYERLVSASGDAGLLISPFDKMAERAGCRVLADINRHYPAYPGQGLVIRQGSYPAILPALTAWLNELDTARAEARTRPQAAEKALASQGVPAPLAPALIALTPGSLMPDRQGIELLGALRREVGLAGDDCAYEDVVDARILQNIGLPAELKP